MSLLSADIPKAKKNVIFRHLINLYINFQLQHTLYDLQISKQKNHLCIWNRL